MSDPFSMPDSKAAVFGQFFAELEEAADPRAVIGKYGDAHPHWAAEFHEQAAFEPAIAALRPAVEESSSELPRPHQLGEFQIVRRTGRGGMGEIYEAVHERLKRRVAIKVIRRGRVSFQARARFLREQTVLARLHQTHIVPIHMAGEEGELQYLVMPYIDGAALHHVVRTAYHLETAQSHGKTPTLAELAGLASESKNEPVGSPGGAVPQESAAPPPPLPTSARTVLLTLSLEYFRSVAQVLADAAEALHHAHDAHVLHRDVKPSNILVDKEGQCWLIDFGLAGYLNGPEDGSAPRKAAELGFEPLTESGILGTPQYMAPEQFEGKADARTDVWGLGVTLYELLTLRQAFDDLLDPESRKRSFARGPTPPQKLVRNIPVDLTAICRKAIYTDSAQRYQTAGEFAEDLRRWLRLEPTRARPAWPLRRTWLWARRNKGWAAVIFVAMVAVVARFVADKIGQWRKSQMYQLQSSRLRGHENGWFEDVWERVRKIAKIRKGDDLRDQAAATLAGIDARLIKVLPLDAFSITFDAASKRLLIGGHTNFQGVPSEPARIWDGGVDDPRKFEPLGSGPVLFRTTDGAALQLIAHLDKSFAIQLWNLDKSGLIREFPLAATPPPKEWRPMNSVTLAVSADGSRVAAAATLPDRKGTLRVWDVHSGKEILRLEKHGTALAFSPDSTLLAGGDADGTVTVWSLDRAEVDATLPVSRTPIRCLAFARDPRRQAGKEPQPSGWLLASGDSGSSVTIWDLRTKRLKAHCRGSVNAVHAVAFSPDGTLLASAGRTIAKLWDAATGRELLSLSRRNWMTGVAFSPDGKRLAVSYLGIFGTPGGVDVWELEYGHGIQTLHGLSSRVMKVCISPNDQLLAALSADWQVAIWELSTGKLLHVLDAPVGYFTDNTALAFSRNGDRFAFSAKDQAKLWEVASGKEIDSWPLPPGFGDFLAFDPTGKKLISVRLETEGRQVPPSGNFPYQEHPRVCRVRDLLGPDREKEFAAIKDFKRDAGIRAIAPDASCFVLVGIPDANEPLQRVIGAFDTNPGTKTLLSLPVTVDGMEHHPGIAIDPTGKLLVFLVANREQSTAALIEMPSGKTIRPLRFGGSPSPGAKLWYNGPHVSIFRDQDAPPRVTFDIDGFSSSSMVASPFNAKGTHLAWGNVDGTVCVCDISAVQQRLAAVDLGW
jgi:serine/threonine protein kinase/WD40 repeat protein